MSVRSQRRVYGDAYKAIGPICRQLGLAVSPDDCSLALRGLQTLGVRLDRLELSTLKVARWIAEQPGVEAVFHPALPSCPGHAIWKRDFLGSASVFSILFESRFTSLEVERFIDALKFFKIGFSWGGVTSLAIAYPSLERPGKDFGGRLVRLNIGLEEPEDLIEDLSAALKIMDNEDLV